MNKSVLALGCAAVLGVLVLVGIMVGGTYNRLVGLEEGVDRAWAEVENTYQRRADLIPNLVETVKGARDFERDTFEAVANARSKAGQTTFEGPPDAAQMAQFQEAQGELTAALSRLMLVVERYPELKATEAFRDLQSQLEGTENRIAVARRRYNEEAQGFNTARRRFPTNLIANVFGFDEKVYFQAEDGADTAPEVDFS